MARRDSNEESNIDSTIKMQTEVYKLVLLRNNGFILFQTNVYSNMNHGFPQELIRPTGKGSLFVGVLLGFKSELDYH